MKAKLVKESLNILKAKSQDEILDSLKKSSKNPNDILIKSVDKGFLFGVKYALENGANVHTIDDYALRWASQNGHYDIVKLLLDYGADIHTDNDEALRWAAYEGHYDVIKLLLENGADIHAQNDAALRHAEYNGHTDVVELLKSYINK